MRDITEVCELEVGIVVDGRAHFRAELRAARLVDSYAAAAAVAIPVGLQDDERARVAYQMAVDDAQVLAQVAVLGDLDAVPPIEVLIDEIDPDDMGLLRAAAGRLKKKLRLWKHGSPPIAAPSTSSSEPASA